MNKLKGDPWILQLNNKSIGVEALFSRERPKKHQLVLEKKYCNLYKYC